MGERERSLQELLQVIDGWNAAKQQQQNTNYRLPAENELKQSINALAALHDLPPPISDE
jgi:uroporphyrinogen-III decarboxylase